MNPNTVWAETFIDGLVHAGVRRVTLAPGARSIPLVLAAAARTDIEVVTQLDERCAAFVALGYAKATGVPAAVITTSGTAAANLLPAVVEASQSDTPLLLLTADRPAYLRGTDANQTIDQIGLYGRYLRGFFDAGAPTMEAVAVAAHGTLSARVMRAAAGPPAGPVHVNFPFAKPLEPDGHAGAPGGGPGPPAPQVGASARAPGARARRAIDALVRAARRPLLIAGPLAGTDAGAAVLRLAARWRAPLLADPLSGARYGPGAGEWALDAYDAYLHDETVQRGLAPDLIVRFGPTPTSSALVPMLTGTRGTPHVVIDGGSRWSDHLALATEYVAADPAPSAEILADGAPSVEAGWLDRWRRADRCVGRMLDCRGDGDPFEGTAVATVAAAMSEGATLVIGNSLPVRDLDRYGRARDTALRVIGNRGASGIDGMVSTAVGVATAGRPTVAVLGDLSFLHDVNGLFGLCARGDPITLLVINNDGGGIFHGLPVRAFEPAFTRHVVVPHGLDLSHAAALHEIPFSRTDLSRPLGATVRAALAARGPAVIEIRTDRVDGWRRRESDREAAAAAARDAVGEEKP